MRWRWFIFSLCLCNLGVWGLVLAQERTHAPQIYFFDVGQGDSELIVMDGVKILVDGGPDAAVLERLSEVLPFADRYLDVVMLTHPHLDHFGGLIDVLKNYQVGIFIDNGFVHDTPQYQYFAQELSQDHVRRTIFRDGDRLTYQDLVLKVISPREDARPTKTKDIHDNTIVFLLEKANFRGLFTGDINFKVEGRLLSGHRADLVAMLLKVSHHGSNQSTSNEFLAAVRPKVSIIEVGKHNPYGHPKQALLERLQAAGASIYRTDQDGTIRVSLNETNIKLSVAQLK